MCKRLFIIHYTGVLMVMAIVGCMGAAAFAAVTPHEVAAAKARLADPELRGERRLEAIEHVLRLRRDLMVQPSPHPHRAIWLADQASDLLYELLAHDGLGLTAMFGWPTADQKQRAEAAVREALECAQQAEADVMQTIATLETSPDVAREGDRQQLLRELVEVQRERRIPFLRGVSACWHAHLNVSNAAPQRSFLTLADRVLTPLTDTLQESPAIEARLYAGLAKARLGEYDAGEMLFAAAARDPAATPAQVFTARMGGVVNRTINSGHRAGLDALAGIEQRYSDSSNPAHLFYRILIADHAFGLRRELAAQAAPDQRERHLADAFASYITMLRGDLGAARETVRAIIFERLTRAVAADDDVPLHALPGLVTVAHADHLAGTPASRERAITMLEEAFQHQRLEAEARPAGLYVLGRALLEHGERLFAAQRLIELATQHPADFNAQRSIETAVAIAANLHRSAPDDDQTRQTLREGLSVLLEKYPNLPSINRWRYAAARLALDERRYDDALATLAQITPDAVEWPDAHFMQVTVARQRALGGEIAEAHALSQQVIAAIERVRPVLQAALSTADASRSAAIRNYIELLRIYRAETLLRMNQPQIALNELAGFEQQPQIDGRVMGEALRVRISAFQALRQPEEAQADIERFARAAPSQVGTVFPAVLASMHREVEALLEAGRETEARDLAARTMLPTAELLEHSLRDATDSMIDPAVYHHVAAAYLFSGRFAEAEARFDRLLGASPNAAEFLLGRAESLLGIGGEQQLADAMIIYKRLAAAGPDANRQHYWLSQWRMLQILDRVNRNTDQILPRIERLRQQDRDFGGERFKRGFEALRMKYAAK